MNWDAIGAIAELTAALGVIITLIYLAIQIRNSTTVDRANIRANLTAGSHNVLAHAAENAEIFVKINTGEELTDAERLRVAMFHRMAFRSYENYTYQHNLGLLDDSEWKGFFFAIEAFFKEPYAREDWRALRQQYSPAFQKLVDPLVPELDDQSKMPKQSYA